MSVVEFLSPNDVICCLWNKNSPEKCRIGLADAVVYEAGVPAKWFVTGKTGEVLKKRGVDIPAISQRWSRICAQNNSSVVGIIRQQGGILKFLNEEAWKNFTANIVPDTSVLSVHCFVKGNNKTVFRNRFELRDKLGRFLSTTHSYTFQYDSTNTEALSIMNVDGASFVESKATPLKNIMDLATNTVVRYIEMMLGIKVLSLSVDYVIDTKSQLWMLWTSEAKFVRSTNITDMDIPGLFLEPRVGRMSWAGPKYEEGLADIAAREEKSPTSKLVDAKLSRSDSLLDDRSDSASEDVSVGAQRAGKKSVLIANVISVVSSASVVVDDAASKTLKKNRRQNIQANQQSFTVVPTDNSITETNFPDPFKCKGDFCKIRLQTVGPLYADDISRQHTAERFFSEKEINILRKDKRFPKMMEFGADGPALAVISMKSIVKAREERKHMDLNPLNGKEWKEYPITPRQQIGSAKVTTAEREEKQANADQAKEAMLAQDKEHREDFTKKMITYYEQVRVCGVCFETYTLLDWARAVLGREDAHGANLGPERSSSLSAARSSSVRALSRDGSIDLSKSASSGAVSDQQQTDRFAPPPERNKSRSGRSRNGKSRSPQRGSDPDGDDEKKTWKSYLEKDPPKGKRGGREKPTARSATVALSELDMYLREGSDSLAARKAVEKEEFLKMRVSQLLEGSSVFEDNSTKLPSNVYCGKILLAVADEVNGYEAKGILEEAYFDVTWVRDGRQAVNKFFDQPDDKGFDCVLVQRDLPLIGAMDVTKAVREEEKRQRKRAAAAAAAEGRGVQPPTRRHPVICYTTATSAEDLKQYMQADMDGCVSYPVSKVSLLNTVRAAVPHHLAATAPPEPEPANKDARVYKLGSFGELEGATDSATIAAKSLITPGTNNDEDDCSFHGVIQLDADTRVPYTVLDASRKSKIPVNPRKPFFNLIVCHDLFDTAERLKIFLRPIVQRYLGLQVLLWNYPGQAFTEWREEQLLNNEYLATCLNDVLGQVGEKGTKDFDTSRPFYIMGCGNGSSVAAFYASHYRVPNLRGILSINGWSFLDSYLAGLMHDCINVFECSPPSRPDLPVYFFSRFLFSKDYLAKVSVPLALNIYTAVHNPISLKGRINLCKGVLHAVDLRPLLNEIDCPVICIQSTQDAMARPIHSEAFVQHRGGEVRSIFKALKNPSKTCVVWMSGGHEMFQENKKQAQTIIEQILTGFHETHDITFPAAPTVDKASAEQGVLRGSDPSAVRTVEDKFIDNVLGSMSKMSLHAPGSASSSKRPDPAQSKSLSQSKSEFALPSIGAGKSGKDKADASRGLSSAGKGKERGVVFTSSDPAAWQDFSQTVAEGQKMVRIDGKSKTKGDKPMDTTQSSILIDPTTTAFERQDSLVYGPKSKSVNIHEFPEVKEYMGWRLKRNKKRLQRLQGAARVIQAAFRAFLARQLVNRMRRQKAARIIQRRFRGYIGRCKFLDQARRIWAGQTIQRAYRGYRARKWYFQLKVRIAAAVNIQRVFRGHRARLYVAEVHRIRNKAATIIQAMFRRTKARKDAWRRRYERNAAVAIQRIYRGHLGRRRAMAERDKYIFSRSQSQGIEFGRQMLLEHKLHATRLQSDVTLLSQEKVGAEELVEALLEEISGFEEGVRTLEKEMHQLSKVEAEAAAFMDEESKYELREQKIRLDAEFGEMLAKIGSRKEMLNDLERKLSSIDKARQAKEEELRTLERKLVVLLEEQQNELNAIKRKQDVRGALLAASHEELMKATSGTPGGQSQALVVSSQGLAGGGGGGGGGGGPSLQEKRQAAQLMQSTETLMKFGFMSMSMTYFSSLNMIKALRTVSAQDTVMAALADVHAQRAAGFGSDGGGGASEGKEPFLPGLKKGQLPGQEALRVSAWSVEDVAKWLQTISLGQYCEAFIDAAIDGEFLYDINDDDLKNTLGIEHRLHRKKILGCVHRLKLAEAQVDSRLNSLLREGGGLEQPSLSGDQDSGGFPKNPFEDGKVGAPGDERRMIDGPKIPLSELMSLVRHSKLSLVKQALDYLPNKTFDKTLVQAPYVTDHGTVYVEGYERLPFHMNKTDDFGNTMLSLACQNGNVKIAKYLIAKGGNPNHQNKQGQTGGHFAVSYKFFDLSQWLFENGADDTIENKFGLTPYDGLEPEDGEAEG